MNEFGNYCSELDHLIKATVSHRNKIKFDLKKVKESLINEDQRKLNKNVCQNIIQLNQDLLGTFQQIIDLKNKFSNGKW